MDLQFFESEIARMEAEVGFEGFTREDFQKHNKLLADFKKKYTN